VATCLLNMRWKAFSQLSLMFIASEFWSWRSSQGRGLSAFMVNRTLSTSRDM
jgi:hypothetical protein